MGGAGPDHDAGGTESRRGSVNDGYGDSVGRCVDQYDPTVLGIAGAWNRGTFRKGYNGILSDHIVLYGNRCLRRIPDSRAYLTEESLYIFN